MKWDSIYHADTNTACCHMILFFKTFRSMPRYEHSLSLSTDPIYENHVHVDVTRSIIPMRRQEGTKVHPILNLPTQLLQMWCRHKMSKLQLMSPLNPTNLGKSHHFGIQGVWKSEWTSFPLLLKSGYISDQPLPLLGTRDAFMEVCC